MEERSSEEHRQRTEVVVRGPDGRTTRTIDLRGERLTFGRAREANDVVLAPDPQQLVGRTAHCAFELEGGRWFVVDGGSVNGTLLRRGSKEERVAARTALRDGDVVRVLALVAGSGERRYFELVFHSGRDPHATRPAGVMSGSLRQIVEACLEYDASGERLLLRHGGERHEIRLRPQGHRLVRYMADRNASAGGSPVLCTHDELVYAVWGEEPLHTRGELARLVWELRRALSPHGAAGLVESEPRRGYRLRTCPAARGARSS
jgi:DNA-binding winged helix-turn-helix (wHTH) protein